MNFRNDHCKADAHLLAEECRAFSSTLGSEEKVRFLSNLVEELTHDLDNAALTEHIFDDKVPSEFEWSHAYEEMIVPGFVWSHPYEFVSRN